MSSYGQYNLGTVGSGISVSADGAPVAKVAGVTVNWAGVKALAAARTFKDYDAVDAGEKFLRYGTILCKITAATNAAVVGMYVPLVGTGAAGQYTAYNGDASMAVSQLEGDAFILNRSVHENDIASDYPEVIDGGRVYKRRLLVVGYGDGTGGYPDAASDGDDLTALGIAAVAAATFKTALPQVTFVTEG